MSLTLSGLPVSAPSPSSPRPYIGGQALLEGVMMRSPHSFAIVCRRQSGELVVRERPIVDLRQGVRAWPFVRGVMTLVESVKLGSEALRISAAFYEKDHEQDGTEKGVATNGTAKPATKGVANVLSMLAALSLPIIALASLPADGAPEPLPPPEEGKRSALGSLLMIGFAVALFIAAPQAGASGLNRLFHLHYDIRSAPFQLLTGAMKLTIVIGYLLLIRRVPDIRRVFQYHGAEHKTIAAYEAVDDLVVSSARNKSTLHPRCGTTFLVLVALVSVLVFTAISPLLPHFGGTSGGLLENVALLVMKLPFLPLIAAITFELQRLTARYCTRGPLRALLWPGFLVQKITTIEPDDDQLEVALASLRATLWREANPAVAPTTVTSKSFPSYDTFLKDEGYAAAR